MRIVEIRAYRVELPLREGAYKWSGGNRVAVFDSTVVAVEATAPVHVMSPTVRYRTRASNSGSSWPLVTNSLSDVSEGME